MNILAICHDIAPLETPQAVQIGRHLANMQNCAIALVSGGGSIDARPAQAIGNIQHHLRVPAPQEHFKALRRIGRLALPVYAKTPDALGSWKADVLQRLPPWLSSVAFKPDVIASFGEPMTDHLIAMELKRSTGLPWLAHFSDPWSDNPFRRGGPVTRHLNARLEKYVVEAADIVVFTSDETAELVGRRYDDQTRKKFHVVGHAFDERLFPARTRPDGKLLLSHIGSFYGKRTPFPLVRALQKLAASSPQLAAMIHVELVGSMPGRMVAALRRYPLPAGLLTMTAPVVYGVSLVRMVQSDLLLLIDAPATQSVFLASKLVDYIGSGRPVFAITPPGTADRVVRCAGGTCVAPGDPDAIAKALETVIRGLLEQRTLAETTPVYDPVLRQAFSAPDIAARLRSCLELAMSPASV
jgi:glycosyltransferase involved in cell wall biosynthesis